MIVTINEPKKLVGKERILIDLLETEDVNGVSIEREIVTKLYFEFYSDEFFNEGNIYKSFIVVDTIISFDELKIGKYYIFEYFASGMGYDYISVIGESDVFYGKGVWYYE